MCKMNASAVAAMMVAAIAAPPAAGAAALKVVSVAAPAVNCLFAKSCKLRVTDTIGNLPPVSGYSGTAILQSRTARAAKHGVPGAGTTVYMYRIDLTKATAQTDQMCVTAIAVDFGPLKPLPYSGAGNADVFVITSGGLGSIGLQSADQTGATIKFQFSTSSFPDPHEQFQPVCPGQTSFFFGLAALKPPVAATAQVTMGVYGTKGVAARAPAH
jgi:hypothetical protein